MNKKSILAALAAVVAGISAVACSPTADNGSVGTARDFSPYNASQALTISRDLLEEKIQGGWLGALWGNFTGLPTEFKFIENVGPDSALDWKVSNCYVTDDDTSFEYVFLHMMEVYGVDTITYEDMPDEWIYHFQDYLWVGNLSALELMKKGVKPPETGKKGINPDAEAIDAQIECEIFGMITPGMLGNCYGRTKWWAEVIGDGAVVYNSAFYAMLCSDAFFTDDIHASLANVRAYFADGSETAQIYDAVKAEYDSNKTDWKAARQNLYKKYYNGDTLDNKINFAMTLLALMYGENDYMKTVGIAVLAGFDNDCNAATAGTIMGIQVGLNGLPEELMSQSGDYYLNTNRPGLASATVGEIGARIAEQAEDVILNAGGIKNGDVYTIYDATFTPAESKSVLTKRADDSQWIYGNMYKFYNSSFSNGYGYGTTSSGGYAEIQFKGEQITLYASTSPNGGKFALTLDGKDMGVINLQAEETFTAGRMITVSNNQILKRIRGLGDGDHTLRLTALEDGKWHSIDYAAVVCGEDEYYESEWLNYARTAAATPVASVINPLGIGAGGGGVSVINDGKYYSHGMESKEQYDSYLGRNSQGVDYVKTGEDYVGYTFDRTLSVGRIVFNEGGLWGDDGGWFANGEVRVEVLINGVWQNAKSTVSPKYPVGNTFASMNSNGGRVFTFTFDTVKADGVRVIGAPGGTRKIISCGEMEVYKK